MAELGVTDHLTPKLATFFFFKHHAAPQVDVSKVAPRKNGVLRIAVHG